MNEVRVNRKAADRVASGHPWIFASDVVNLGRRAGGRGREGCRTRAVRPLGTAHYSAASQIALRMLSRAGRGHRARFLYAAIARGGRASCTVHRATRIAWCTGKAICCRRWWWTVWRIPGGSDARPGDGRGQGRDNFLSPGDVRAARDCRAQRRLRCVRKSNCRWRPRFWRAKFRKRWSCEINGLNMRADLLHGQKTGIFLDQRENYRAAAQYARGGKALDCFTSTGGFRAPPGGEMPKVEAVDSSEAGAGNGARQCRSQRDLEHRIARSGRLRVCSPGTPRRGGSSGLVVLDPPAFAKSRKNVEAAATGYKEIDLRELRLLGPGGIW